MRIIAADAGFVLPIAGKESAAMVHLCLHLGVPVLAAH
jgi:hypothetical protein